MIVTLGGPGRHAGPGAFGLCIGVDFALMEAQLLLTTIVGAARLRCTPGHRAVPGPQMTLRPRGGMPMFASPRHFALAEPTTPPE